MSKIPSSIHRTMMLMGAPDPVQFEKDNPQLVPRYRKPSKKREHPEEDYQIECYNHIKQFTNIESWAVPNQVARVKNTNEGAFMHYLKRLRDMGVKKGVVDIHFFFNAKFCVWECKAGYNKPDDEQLRYMKSIVDKGGFAGWGTTLQQFKEFMKTCGAC